MQYSIVGNDIALIMHYRALLKRSVTFIQRQDKLILIVHSMNDSIIDNR